MVSGGKSASEADGRGKAKAGAESVSKSEGSDLRLRAEFFLLILMYSPPAEKVLNSGNMLQIHEIFHPTDE